MVNWSIRTQCGASTSQARVGFAIGHSVPDWGVGSSDTPLGRVCDGEQFVRVAFETAPPLGRVCDGERSP